MSEKQPDRTEATVDKTETTDETKSAKIPPVGLSSDATSVPPPPVSGAGTVPPPPVSGAGSMRAPRLPMPSTRPPAPSRPGVSNEDIFSIFKTQATGGADSVSGTTQPPPPVSEKPKSQLGLGSEEREITRSRQIPIDQDLFNLSSELFSNSQRPPPVVAPDMAAKDAGALDDLLFTPAPTAPVAPLESIDKIAPKAPAFEPAAKPSSGGSNRMVLVVGIAAALLSAGGMFLYMRNSSPNQPTASVQPQATTEAAADTRPGQTPAANEPQARPAATDKPQEAPAAAGEPTAAPAGTDALKEASDKPGSTASPDKQAAADKPAEPEASAKPAEPEPAPAPTSTEPAKPPSLAEAMAAAAGPGKTATPAAGPAPAPAPTETAAPPPTAAPAGPEFNKAAATAALNGAAGSAAGCKAAGDPSGQARVSITFAPSGRATRAIVNGPPFAGTATGSCVAAAFRSLSIPPFSGDPVTVTKSVSIP